MPNNSADPLTYHPVDREHWPDMERLFEAPGGPKYCWCMAWRATPEEVKRTDSASRKAALKRRVDAGIPIGILGYLGDEPVAWCSVAPRPTYRPLGGVEEAGEDPHKVWSIVCFYTPRRRRGQGTAPRMLAAAIEHARRQGATVIEAYPVERTSPSYRHMGFISMFETAGFREVGRAGTRRHVMRLWLK